MTPTARTQENILIFMPLLSETAPRNGPRTAQSTVAMDAAYPQYAR